MARLCLIALQLAVLAFAGLAVAVLATPFTPQGFVHTPSRVQAGLFIFSAMPGEGIPFLRMLKYLVWVPAATAAAAFAPGDNGALRLVRRAAAFGNLAAFGCLARAFPGLASADRLPVLLFGVAALFCCNAAVLFFLPRKPKATRPFAVFLLLLLGAGSLAVFAWGALRQTLPPLAWTTAAGCGLALFFSFHGLVKALSGAGKKNTGAAAVSWLVPVLLFAFFCVFSPPLALPVGAGLLLALAALWN